MDEAQIIKQSAEFLTMLTSHGVEGLIATFLVYERFVKPWRKKSNGTWRSWESMEKKIDGLEAKLNLHLEKEIQEDIIISSLNMAQKNLNEKVSTETAHIFSQLKDLWAATSGNYDNLHREISEVKNILLTWKRD